MFHLVVLVVYEVPLPVSSLHSFHSSELYSGIPLICLASNFLHKKPNFAFVWYLNAVQFGSFEHASATKSLLPLIDLP